MEEAEKAALALDGVVYTNYREVRTTAKKGAGKFLKFFLIDDREREVLAATAEDQGDAHYLYKNAKGFTQHGKLESHNRKEVIMWLEKIIRESPFQVNNKQEEEDLKLLPTEDHPEGLYFVDQRQERITCPDGRKSNKFFLIDQYGVEHLAVVGEESHARDGHYHYIAHEPFASASPLSSRNANGVYHWLEQWLSHNALTAAEEEAQGAPVGQAPSEECPRARPRSVVLEMGDWGDGEGKAMPPRMLDLSRLTGTRKRLTGAAEASHQKRMKLMHSAEAAAAEELQAAWLQERRMAAGADAEARKAEALSSLAWLKEAPSDDEVTTVEYWHSILREMVEAWEAEEKLQDGDVESMEVDIVPESPFSSPDASAPPAIPCHPNPKSRHWLRLCLEALKEVGTMYMPLKLMSQTGIMSTVTKLKDHPNSSISRYSQYIALQWRTQMLAHCRTLLDPAILSDPVGDLEEALLSGSLAPPMLGPKDPPPAARRLKCAAAFEAEGRNTPSGRLEGGTGGSKERAGDADPEQAQRGTVTKSGDDCSHCEADTTHDQPSEIGKDASPDIADVTEVEGTAHEGENGALDDGDEGTAMEEEEVKADGGESDIGTDSDDNDGDCPMAGSESPGQQESPTADGLVDGVSVDPREGGQGEQDEAHRGELRSRIASKELPRTTSASEGPRNTEADGDESDLGLLLADIPEEFFPEDEEVSGRDSGD